MSNIAIPNTFAPSTTALSAEVNANFTEIQTKFNSFAVQKDVAATITVAHTFNTAPVFGFATASQALELDASKNVQSVAITGTGNYVKSASPTFTGTVTMAGLETTDTVATLVQSATVSVVHVGSGTGSGATQLNIRGAAGQLRELSWRSGTVARWKFYANSDPESGANAGSTFYFAAYDDAGAAISDIWSVVRAANGAMSITRPVTITATSGAQLSVRYDGSNHATLTVSAAGVATFNATGASASFVFSDSVTVNSTVAIAATATTNALTVTTTGAITSSFRYDGSNRLDLSVSAAGVVTLDAVGASAAFALSDALTVAGHVSANDGNLRLLVSSTLEWDVSIAAGGSAAAGPAVLYNAADSGRAHTFVDNTSAFLGEFSRSASADDTYLMVFDHTAVTMKRVTRGAADSGGTGYRLLRITN